MTPKVSVYVATSVDGFIAREDGELDWLNAASATVPEGEDCGFRSFLDSVDVLVLGRRTYEQVRTFGDWPYGETPVVVLSHRPMTFAPDLPGVVTHSSEAPRALRDRLASEGARHLYVDGGQTIQRFLAEGLVDEITITVIPILIGRGLPLFGPSSEDVALECLDSRSWDFGFVQSRYAVVHANDRDRSANQ